MRKKTEPEENKTFGLTPSVPWRISKVQSLDNYRLQVRFLDGLEGYVDLLALVTGKNAGVFSVLQDKKLFAQAYLDHGAVTWPGELDLAPDAMYDVIKEHGTWTLS